MAIERTPQHALSQLLAKTSLPEMTEQKRDVFLSRLDGQFSSLYSRLHELYGHRDDFSAQVQYLLQLLADGFIARNERWQQRDQQMKENPYWYLSEEQLGMSVYVDLFAGDLKKLRAKIPYLKQLGVSYLHLMPLYKSPEKDSDGGYAVSDYRRVDPRIGNEQDLLELAEDLDDNNIRLVLDFVFNHTSDEHEWAIKARGNDPEFAEFYYFFTDANEVKEYNATCREIFPSVRRGSFSYLKAENKWVWTTFNNFQWDLNYSNPAVFNAITDEMLFLANIGCQGLRLDALAFIWKEKGTVCESLPKAHTLIQCFNACLRIVAPSVLFKSEAIVHPDEVSKYISPEECQLSYNPLLMALMWESLATRETKLLTASLKKSFAIDSRCSWVNYIRCHDDIGWTFDDTVAENKGINGYSHRKFLNRFYTSQFDGSFATGEAFQLNPETGDCRVCGSLASLAGVEQALDKGDTQLLDYAIKRIRLLNSIILSIGGIPLIYQGDELGLLNDYSYVQDPHKKYDARWVNRPIVRDEFIELSRQKGSYQYRIRQQLEKLLDVRRQNPVFGSASTEILETYRPSLFAYTRHHRNGNKLLVLCNFSESKQQVPISICDTLGARCVVDLLSHRIFHEKTIELKAYDVLWLVIHDK